ncbi:MAG: ABC transporter permease subunit [Hamadaea sp.]|nr:ABC transporter permease subunit [Hamadaea sp.]
MTWRQHRAELLAVLALLVVAAVPIVLSGLSLHDEYQASGAAACVADPGGRAGCADIVDRFVAGHIEWGNRFVFVAAIAGLAGVFIGAPLLAREFENGTWRLAFTQTVTRTRWLATKLAVVAAAVALAAVAAGLLITWWRGPLNEIDGRLRSAAFVTSPVSLAVTTMFAFALGVFAAAVIRRTILAMAVTLGGYLAVRIPVEESVRQYYLPATTRITPVAAQPDAVWAPTTDWVVDSGWVDSAGRLLTDAEQAKITTEVYGDESVRHGGEQVVERYLADHGFRRYAEIHPDGSFAAMQAIEAALFLGLAGVLIAGAVWIVRRRLT